MPNWCSNNIVFSSPNKENLEKLLKDFLLYEKEKNTDGFMLPCVDVVTDGFIFDFYASEEIKMSNDNCYYTLYVDFESRWEDISESIARIATYYDVDFEYSFSEGINSFYGKTVMKNGVLHRYVLPTITVEKLYNENKDEDGNIFDSFYDNIDYYIDSFFSDIN